MTTLFMVLSTCVVVLWCEELNPVGGISPTLYTKFTYTVLP